MARLITILIFCVSLTNIFGYDHLKSHNLRHLQLSHRANSNKNKTCNCARSQLIFRYNSTSKFEYVYNQSGEVGLVSDIKSTIVIVFNNRNRLAIAIDYKSQIGVCFRNNSVHNLDSYFQNASNLRNVFEAGRKQGETFNTSSIPANVSQEAQPILKSLSPNYSNISDILPDAQRSCAALRLYSNNFQNVRSRIYGDFHSLSQRLASINGFIRDVGSRVSLNSSSIDLGKILNQQTGAGVFSSLLKQLGLDHTPEEVLGDAFNSPGRLFSLVSSLGGGANPVDTLFQIWAEFFHIGTTPIRLYISFIIQFFSTGVKVFGSFLSALQNLAQTINQAPSGSPSGLENFVQSLVNRSGSINGFNVSQILEILQNRNNSSSIDNIVHLLTLLQPGIPLEQSIPTLLGQLISLYRSGQNNTLSSLIPNFGSSPQQNSDSNNSANVINQLLRVGTAAASSVIQFWASIPLNFFVIPISNALSQFSNTSLVGIFQSQSSLSFFYQAIEGGPAGLLSNSSGLWDTIQSTFGNAVENIVPEGNKTGNSNPIEDLAQNFEDSILGRSARSRSVARSEDKRARRGSKKIVAAAEDVAGNLGDSLGRGSGLVKDVVTHLSHREKKSQSQDETHHAHARNV